MISTLAERMMGDPRTLEERAERHHTLYGPGPLPPRGTGLEARASGLADTLTREARRASLVNGTLTMDEIHEIATKTADEVMSRVRGRIGNLTTHVMENVVRGNALVVDPVRARATPCKCFDFEKETYCWSPGCVGLISSKKNPEQLAEFCALGREPAGEGAKERFAALKGAITEAHEEWEKKGEGLAGWWEQVGKSLGTKGIEL